MQEGIVYSGASCVHHASSVWEDFINQFFCRNPVNCQGCDTIFNFSGFLKHFESKFLAGLGSSGLLGLKSILCTASIFPDELLEIKAKDLKIPAGARIVEVICTANGDGGLRPIYEPPQALNHRKYPKVFHFNPIRIKKNCVKTKVVISITWVDDPYQDILFYAYNAYMIGDYIYSIVPLNVYIESKCRDFLSAMQDCPIKFSDYKHKTFLKRFTNEILVPFEEIDKSSVAEIVELLRKLCDARDNVGHQFKPEDNEKYALNIGQWFTAVVLFKGLLKYILTKFH